MTLMAGVVAAPLHHRGSGAQQPTLRRGGHWRPVLASGLWLSDWCLQCL